jgi:O-antigen/teichoic acid export membrane protein
MVTHSITPIFYGLVLFSIVRLALLRFYARRQYGPRLFPADPQRLRTQLAYGLPFGLAGALYSFRTQAEQWIVSGMYQMRDFAVFSASLLVIPVLQLLYQPVAKVIQPRIHACAAVGDLKQAHALNRRANVSVGFITYPLIVFSIVFADQIVALLLPDEFSQSAQIMRVYLIAQFRLGMEGTSMMQVLGQGRFTVRLTAILLVLAILISGYGAINIGLVAAATGSVVTMLFEALVIQIRLSKLLHIRFTDIQDWGTHARVLAMALLSNVIALFIVSTLTATISPLAYLLTAGSLMVATYVLLSGPFRLGQLSKQILFWRGQQVTPRGDTPRKP